MTNLVVSNVTTAANIVNYVIKTKGFKENLSDSMHAPASRSIINLPPHDLQHHLNKLKHQPQSSKPDFASILAYLVLGINRLDKITYITDLCKTLPSYNDFNWTFKDEHAHIILEFANHDATL